MRKRLGEVYTLKWEEPDPIRVKPPWTVSKKCSKCSKDLTPEDKSSFFFMCPENNYERPLTFVSLYRASKVTGISINAPRNACKKVNMTISDEEEGYKHLKLTGHFHAIVVSQHQGTFDPTW